MQIPQYKQNTTIIIQAPSLYTEKDNKYDLYQLQYLTIIQKL